MAWASWLAFCPDTGSSTQIFTVVVRKSRSLSQTVTVSSATACLSSTTASATMPSSTNGLLSTMSQTTLTSTHSATAQTEPSLTAGHTCGSSQCQGTTSRILCTPPLCTPTWRGCTRRLGTPRSQKVRMMRMTSERILQTHTEGVGG